LMGFRLDLSDALSGSAHRSRVYRGTSLIRKRLPLGPYGRPLPRAL